MNVRITNALASCAPYTPRVFTAQNITDVVKPVTNRPYGVTSTYNNGVLTIVTDDNHGLVAGDSITLPYIETTGGVVVSATSVKSFVAQVTSADSFIANLALPTPVLASDTLIVGTIWPDIWFRRAGLVANSSSDTPNANDVALGHLYNSLPYTIAPGTEFSLLAPEGCKMNLAEVWLRPAAAGTNGLVCILY